MPSLSFQDAMQSIVAGPPITTREQAESVSDGILWPARCLVEAQNGGFTRSQMRALANEAYVPLLADLAQRHGAVHTLNSFAHRLNAGSVLQNSISGKVTFVANEHVTDDLVEIIGIIVQEALCAPAFQSAPTPALIRDFDASYA